MRKIKIKSWVYWFKLVIGILLLVIIYRKINQNESVFKVLTQVNPIYIIIALLLLIPHAYIAFIKWRYLLRICFREVSNRESFGSLFFGISLGMVTPGNLGELGRGLFFQNKSKLTVTGLTALDKLSNMLITATFGFSAICFFVLSQLEWNRTVAVFSMSSGVVILLLIWTALFKKGWIRFLFKKIAARFPNHNQIQALLAVFKHVRQRHVFVVLSLTLSWFLIIVFQYYVVILGFTDVAPYQALMCVSAAIFTKMFLPFSFGGLGIREGMTVFYFSFFNISNAAVFNSSLIIFFINFLLPALVGFYFVLQLKGRTRKANVPIEHLEPFSAPNSQQAGLHAKLEND